MQQQIIRQASHVMHVRTIRDQVAADTPAPIIEWDIIISQTTPVGAALLGAELTSYARIGRLRIDGQDVTLPPYEQCDPSRPGWTAQVSSEWTLYGYQAPVEEILAAFARGYYLDGPRRNSRVPLWDGRWMPRADISGMATERPEMVP